MYVQKEGDIHRKFLTENESSSGRIFTYTEYWLASLIQIEATHKQSLPTSI